MIQDPSAGRPGGRAPDRFRELLIITTEAPGHEVFAGFSPSLRVLVIKTFPCQQ